MVNGADCFKEQCESPPAKKCGVAIHKRFGSIPLVAGNWEGVPQMRNQSPISATNATNIAITGFGIVDGNGDAWRMVRKDKLNETQWKKLTASGGLLSDDKKTWYPSEKSLKGSKMKNPGVIAPDKTADFYKSVKDFLRPNLVGAYKLQKGFAGRCNISKFTCMEFTSFNVSRI